MITTEHETKWRAMCDPRGLGPTKPPCPPPAGPFSTLPTSKDKSKAASAGQTMKCPGPEPLLCSKDGKVVPSEHVANVPENIS